MVVAFLRLKFIDDGDGSGKLLARAEAHGFAGEGDAYFGNQELQDFAAQFGAFPLVGRPSVAGGFYEKTSHRLEQELLALECYAIDGKGHLGLQVRMASALYDGTRPDSRHAATLEILTTYESLGQFGRALSALVRGDIDEAVLEGE